MSAVLFKKPWSLYNPGETASFDAETTATLIAAGVAVDAEEAAAEAKAAEEAAAAEQAAAEAKAAEEAAGAQKPAADKAATNKPLRGN